MRCLLLQLHGVVEAVECQASFANLIAGVLHCGGGDEDEFFCSELVAAALQVSLQAEFQLLTVFAATRCDQRRAFIRQLHSC